MISGAHLDYLDRLGQILRSDSRPFGGLQVILSGDFYQLPPVGSPVVFAFQAECWDSLIPIENQHDLTKVYRQTDSTFVKLLERMRFGTVEPADADILRGLSRKLEYEDKIEPVGL
jgi:ATP-dependent DNA helicase PIF1